jgi:hypothetical protein
LNEKGVGGSRVKRCKVVLEFTAPGEGRAPRNQEPNSEQYPINYPS